MSDPTATSPSRRSFLRLAAVAPLAAAGCVTLKLGPAREPAAGPSRPDAGGADPLAAVRAVPLAYTVEPALVFRVLGGRGRCG
jgi:hypothetical protein